MLTWPELAGLCDSGELRKWLPSNVKITSPDGRSLLMLPDVHSRFEHAPWPGSDGEYPARTRDRRAAMRTALERFVKGSAVFLDRDIKELGSRKPRSDMQGFWEFRSQGPMTETRLFGFFARPGAFVATSFRARDEFIYDEGEWLNERHASQQAWDKLTGGAAYLKAPWPVRTRAHLKEYTG